MTAQSTLKALAKEFSIKEPEVQAILEMMDAGLLPPFIARVRRKQVGGLSENQLRRLQLRVADLAELDRRRGTILRQLEKTEGLSPAVQQSIERCTDRFELEDLFVPHRRPEPEVQLAMDRGLTPLADLLVKSMPKPARAPQKPDGEKPDGAEGESKEVEAKAEPAAKPAEASEAPDTSAPSAETTSAETSAAEEPAAQADPLAAPAASAEPATETAAQVPAEAASPAPEVAAETPAPSASPEPDTAAPADAQSETSSETSEAAEAKPAETDAAPATEATSGDAKPTAKKKGPAKKGTPAAPNLVVDPSPVSQIQLTDALKALCEPFVNPDRGIHTEQEAISGAVRILSDRLGRSASLRTTLRRMLRKRGYLQVHPTVPIDKMGRHKPLAKLKSPLKQVQGHKLISLRQAQRERVLTVHLGLDPKLATEKVRASLGKHTNPDYEDLLMEVARRAYAARLLPVIEADVRLELKERSDSEALRFLSNHLRQLMFTPTYGRRAVVGVDVGAKGDWVFAGIDENGGVGKTQRVEVGEKDDAALLAEIQPFLAESGAQLMATGHDKRARAGALRLRKVLAAAELDLTVTMVNEAGLGSYANSEVARKELEAQPVPERMAISIGRRLQDPMAEFLKVDPRHLGLGAEQGLVSKANLKRSLSDASESCTALIGCDVNSAPQSVLSHMPGLDAEAVTKIMEARAQAPIPSREALRSEGILTEVQWTNAAAFLRVPNSNQPLDRSSLHPELYALAGELLQATGGSVEETLGRPGATKGLRREAHNVDENTWRDLMRELSRPGRDPRSFLMRPRLLPENTDPVMLTENRVVEGIVTAVASFGAFIDLGLSKDGIVHISQISSRYIRDARELLSIGQVVRARITDASGPRITLSLKDVPAKERAAGGSRRGGPRRGGRGRGRGRGKARDPREGLRKGDARGMRLGGAKTRRGGPRKDFGDKKQDRGERVDLRKINEDSKKTSSSPFAAFFKKDGDGEEQK